MNPLARLGRWWRSRTLPETKDLSFCEDMAETIRSVCYSDVVYRGELYRRSLPVYIEMVNLARHVGCQRILELGAGLSTGLWARYADQTGAEVTSVCSEFAPTRSYLAETPEAERLDRCVHCIEGFTVTADQMERFYNAGSQDSLAGISAEEIAAALRLFSSPVSSGRPNRRTDWLTREFGGSAMASDILISDKRLVFTPAVLDAYSEGLRYENELDMLRQAESHGRAGVLDDLPGEWDFVFFDSGELSTIVEWTLLRDRVTPGGFVAFHDIYFPKSIKSCVACSAVVADPEWDVVFVDDTTPQGLLIARRGDLPSCGESR